MGDDTAPHGRKLAHAMEHLKTVEDTVAGFATDNPCVALRDTESQPDPRIWRIRGYVSKQPEPCLAILLGDLVHNLRASLDHLAAALKPDRGTSRTHFPVEREDPWRRNPETGRYIDRRAWVRKNFLRDIEGMNPTAQAHIKRVQPYGEGYESIHHPLAILNALDNADQHFELITVVAGIQDPRLVIRGPGFELRIKGDPGIVADGGGIAELRISPRDLKAIPGIEQAAIDAIPTTMATPNAEVQTELTGSPVVAIQMRSDQEAKATATLPNGLYELIDGIAGYVLQPLALYVV